MKSHRKWCNDRKQHTQRPRKCVDRVLAGTTSAVSQRIYELDGFHAVYAEDRLDQEQPQYQHTSAHYGFKKHQDLHYRPGHIRHITSDNEGCHAHRNAGDPSGIGRAAHYLGQNPTRPQKYRVEPAGPDKVREIARNAPAEHFGKVERHAHHAEEEIQLPCSPFVQPFEPVNKQDHGHHLSAFHDQLREGLHQK